MRGGRLLITIPIFILAPTALVAQSVNVLVLDAMSGKPQDCARGGTRFPPAVQAPQAEAGPSTAKIVRFANDLLRSG